MTAIQITKTATKGKSGFYTLLATGLLSAMGANLAQAGTANAASVQDMAAALLSGDVAATTIAHKKGEAFREFAGEYSRAQQGCKGCHNN